MHVLDAGQAPVYTTFNTAVMCTIRTLQSLPHAAQPAVGEPRLARSLAPGQLHSGIAFMAALLSRLLQVQMPSHFSVRAPVTLSEAILWHTPHILRLGLQEIQQLQG